MNACVYAVVVEKVHPSPIMEIHFLPFYIKGSHSIGDQEMQGLAIYRSGTNALTERKNTVKYHLIEVGILDCGLSYFSIYQPLF